MVGRGMGDSAGSGLGEPRERRTIVLGGGCCDVGVEGVRPVGRLRLPALPAREGVTQVVRDVSAAEDEDPLLAQRRQRFSNGEMPGRWKPSVDAQLDDRQVRLRTQVLEDGPGAMVETPVGPERRLLADEVRDASGQLDASRRWVLLLVQLGREPAEGVAGAGVVVAGTKVPGTYQWAEMLRMAIGCGNSSPSLRKPRVQSLSSMAFIGEPWPTKRTGMRCMTQSRMPRRCPRCRPASSCSRRPGPAASAWDCC